MLRPQLLNRHPNQAVEDKYEENILFRFLSFVCKPILTEATEYAIFPGELFYHCIYSLDTIKCTSPKQIREKCITLLDEIFRYFNDKGLDKNQIDVQNAICLVMYAVERCLVLTTPPTYTLPAGVIEARLCSVNPAYIHVLKKRFNKATKLIGDEPLQAYMNAYMQSKELLSEDIATLVDLSRNVEDVTSQKPTKEELEATFTLAYLNSNEGKLLIGFLRSECEIATDGDWARHALAIYRHKKVFVKRPWGYTKWLPIFCTMFGRNVPYQEPNKLDRTKSQKDVEIFLPKQ